MACKENHLTDWKITKRIPINKDNSKKISDSFDNYFKKESIELFWLKNREIFTLSRYRQVLLTNGLSPLPIPHSDENCYKIVIVKDCDQSVFRKVDKCLTKVVENLYESKVFFESISWQSAKTNDKINKEIKDIAGNIKILFEKREWHQVYNAIDYAIFAIKNFVELNSKDATYIDLETIALLKEKAGDLYRDFRILDNNWNSLKIIIAQYCSYSERDLFYLGEDFLKVFSEKLETFGDKLEDYIDFFDIETLQDIQIIMSYIIEQSRKKNIAFSTPTDSKNSFRVRIRNAAGFIDRLIDFVFEESESEDKEILEAIANHSNFTLLKEENIKEEYVQN
jgi:hypothetical protein